MTKQIFINLPVSDLARSTAFYEALGFRKNAVFSDENNSCMVWTDTIYVMLLTHDFYLQFTDGKPVADTQATSAALLCLTFDSKDEVQAFADAAEANGGRVYQVELPGNQNDTMFGYEVADPDGHVWEPLWMDPSAIPPEA